MAEERRQRERARALGGPASAGRRSAAGRAGRGLALTLTLALPLGVAACGGGGSATSQQTSAEDDNSYPNLARVPDQAPTATPASLREELVKGLVADRAHAQYTGELLTPQMAAPPPAAPPPAAKTQVEIRWETLRVVPEEETPGGEISEVEVETEAAVLAVSADAGGASGADGAGASTGAAVETQEAVEVAWDTERVEPNGKLSLAGSEESKSELILSPDSAESVQTAAVADGDAVEINWDTDRVDPSGEVTMAGTESLQGKLLLSPEPELVAIIYFPQDSARIAQDDRDVLQGVMALYQERGGRIHLIGHSGTEMDTGDQVAQRMASLDLSLQRANAVAAGLVDLGAAQEAVLVEAKANREPAASGAVGGGESRNRRVEIFLEY